VVAVLRCGVDTVVEQGVGAQSLARLDNSRSEKRMNAATRSLQSASVWLGLASLLIAASASSEDRDIASQVTAQSACTAWNLATEFRRSPHQANPNPDNCGNANVWYFMESTSLVHDARTYSLLPEFITDAFFVAGIEQWQDLSDCSTSCNDKLPAVGVNATGSAQRIFNIAWPAGSVRMHPRASRLAIVGWRSPINGSISIAGAFADLDAGCGGAGWSVDKGTTRLASGAFQSGGGQQFQRSGIAVSQGDFLYFIVDPGADGDCGDSTGLKVTITATNRLLSHVVVNPESEDFPAELRDIKFGEAVAIRNGIAFVGIPKAADGGHVAVLNLTASGWQRVGTVKLPAFVAQNIRETEFGRALTWRDGVLVVGGSKAAYYFSRSNGIWTFRSVLAPLHRFLGSSFPAALRYEAGETVLTAFPTLPHFIGTLLATELAAPCCPSRVHIFYKYPTGGEFFYAGFVQPSDSLAGDNFGADLSMTKREFVVGSPRGSRNLIAGLPAYNQSGAAYIFRRRTDGTWKQGQKLLPSEPAPGFGTSVAIDNDMIIVGAPKIGIEGAPARPATADGHTAGGAAYVFVPGAGRYVQASKLRPEPDELFKYQDFGYRVAMFGPNVVIAAARPYVPDGFFPLGLAAAYTRDGTSLQLHGIAQGHVVAASMALANNWLLLGAPYERSCPSGCLGSAHIYDLNRLAQ